MTELQNEIELIKKKPSADQKKFYENLLEKGGLSKSDFVKATLEYATLFYFEGDFRHVIEIIEPIVLDYGHYLEVEDLLQCFSRLAVSVTCEGDYNVAEVYFRIALELGEERKDYLFCSIAYNNLSLTYLSMQEYEKALSCLEKAEKYKGFWDEDMGAFVYINKAVVFQKLGRPEDALSYYNIAAGEYNAEVVLKDDSERLMMKICFDLGKMEEYNILKDRIVETVRSQMPETELFDTCTDLFRCGYASDDKELLIKVLDMMKERVELYPEEYYAACIYADLKYKFAKKYESSDIALSALELKDSYREKMLSKSRINHGHSFEQYLRTNEINFRMEKAVETHDKASKAKSDFLFSMSHDIRTPMNAIIGFTELIKKNACDEKKVLDYVGKIESSNEFLLSIINNVLDMARIESGKMEINEEYVNTDNIKSELIS
ncbi:MAG: histidine kinase dimerization/phospho-acceptor domain-containing protein, partial [Clostridia bacterium]|nr:histidine kinase dimerization/phospho-acceptor domain-containing protein [Clostridia bacterium]